MDAPDLATVFASTVGAYYSRMGRDVEDQATATTIRINTTLVEKRAELVLTLLRDLLGIESLEGLRVLEAGSGFGALAARLALAGPRRMVGIDTSQDYVNVARDSARALGLEDRLAFERIDMQAMDAFTDESFDLLIANNSFLYLHTRRAGLRALHEFRRVLAPSGALLIYQANRWRLREPFTNDPIVHLLPRFVAEPVSRATGWRGNHGRVRLVSPPWLRWDLRRAGLRPVGTFGFGRKNARHRRMVMRNFGTWFGQAARRPNGRRASSADGGTGERWQQSS